MMLQPTGAWRSANHHHVVLMNWAKRKHIDIGREGWAGFALYVSTGPKFVIEHRGPGFPTFRHEWSFPGTLSGGVHSNARRWAFRDALEVYLRLSKQEMVEEPIKRRKL